MILVALHVPEPHLVHPHMSYLPSPPNVPNTHPADSCNSGTTIFKNLHGHYAPNVLRWLLLHHPRLLLTLTLPWILDALEGNCSSTQQLDLSRHHMLLGNHHRNYLRQWQTIHCGTRLLREKVQNQTHQNQRLQFVCKQHSWALPLQRPTGTIQSLWWSRAQIVPGHSFSILVGTRDPQKARGLLPIFCSNWDWPSPPFRCNRSKLLTPSARVTPVDHWPHSMTSNCPAEETRWPCPTQGTCLSHMQLRGHLIWMWTYSNNLGLWLQAWWPDTNLKQQ